MFSVTKPQLKIFLLSINIKQFFLRCAFGNCNQHFSSQAALEKHYHSIHEKQLEVIMFLCFTLNYSIKTAPKNGQGVGWRGFNKKSSTSVLFHNKFQKYRVKQSKYHSSLMFMYHVNKKSKTFLIFRAA
jgi:hypothetical protein